MSEDKSRSTEGNCGISRENLGVPHSLYAKDDDDYMGTERI